MNLKINIAIKIDIELHNLFPQDVIFNIQIVYEKNQPVKKGKKEGAASGPGGKGAGNPKDK